MYAPSNTLPQKYLYLPKTPPPLLKILISQRPHVWRKSFPRSDLLRGLILFLVEFWIVFKRTFYRKIYPFWRKISTLLWMLNDFEHERHKENRLQEICGGLVDNDTWNFCCILCPLYQQSVTNIVPGPRVSPLRVNKGPFSRLVLLFVNKHAYQNNPEAIPPPGILLSQRSSIFHLFKLLSPCDPFFSNPYIYDCERLNRYYIFFFAINRSSNRTLCKKKLSVVN